MTKSAFAAIDSFPNLRQSGTLMQDRPCPVCGADEPESIYRLDQFQFFSDNPDHCKRADIHHVRCRRCLTLYMNPAYSSAGFALLFGEAAQSYGASVIRQDEQLDWLRERDLLNSSQILLDVGCYTGNFLATLPPELKAIGVDIDAGAVAEAQAKYGGPHRQFIQADFEHLKLNHKVDVITMFHVLEHLPHPLAVLRKLRALAHARTRLVLEVPVLELAKTNDINGFLTVSHLTHFSVRSVTCMTAAAGWQIVDATLQPDYNGFRFVAIPCESNRLPHDPNDRFLLYDYLANFYQSLAAAQKALSAIPTSPYRLVWGAGFHTELIYQLSDFFQASNCRYLLVDMDANKQGQTWRGLPICHPDRLAEVDWRDCHMLVSSYGHQEAIALDALRRGVPPAHLHRIYEYIRRY